MEDIGTLEAVLIALFVIVQIGLLVVALLDILKRTDEEVVGGKRWVWILIALFVNVVGPILYLALGRRPRAAVDPASEQPVGTDRTRRAVDALYGSNADGDSR